MPRPGRALTTIALAALLACSACSSGPAPGEPLPPGEVPSPDHVLVVVFENKDAQQVVGAPAAPYLTSLAEQGANFTDAHAETHPSQPNYIALFSGSTHGVTDDSCPQSLSGDNLAGQLLDAGKTFVGYSEGLPDQGATVCEVDGYARKHNPWVDFEGLPTEVNQPYTAFPEDYADLPTVAFLIPDLCHDMHDCGVAKGDRWARRDLAPYVEWAKSHNSLLVVTFDESEGRNDANLIPTLLVGPMVRAGDADQRIDHYSILRTIEKMYDLAPIGEAADREPIGDIWLSVGG